MSKLVSQVTVTETDDGFQIDVKGKSLEELSNCGCMPYFGHGMMHGCCCHTSKSDCCEEKK